MKEYINSIAGIISIVACFLIAGIGVFSGNDPITCSYRAVCGAIFVYCVTAIALHIVARIVLTALVENQMQQVESQEQENESQ